MKDNARVVLLLAYYHCCFFRGFNYLLVSLSLHILHLFYILFTYILLA